MRKKIGNVVLDYTHYKGADIYSDGDIEDELLDACMSDRQQQLLYNSNEYAVLYHLSPIRENLLEWYPLDNTQSVLEIGSGCGAMTGILSRKAQKVTCIELSEKRSLINAYRHKEHENIEIYIGNFQEIEPTIGKYDVITLIGVWEYSELYISDKKPFEKMLLTAQKHLSSNGKILIAIENKMGLKYWNGAQEDHTGNQYSGLNDYVDSKEKGVRTFSKREIEMMLKKVGINNYAFYYPMPDYKLPDCIYSEEYLPHAGQLRTFRKEYAYNRLYNFNEAIVNDQICEDGVFEYFANSFFIVCGENSCQVKFAKYNRERKDKFRTETIIEKKNNTRYVLKRALEKESISHIERVANNLKRMYVRNQGISYVIGEIEDGVFVSPYIEGDDIEHTLYLYRNDLHSFIKRIKNIIEILYENLGELIKFDETEAFRSVFGTYTGKETKSFKITNVDLILSNMKYKDGKIYIFDSEWTFDFPIPYKYVMWRLIRIAYYSYYAYLKGKINIIDFLKEFDFNEEENNSFMIMEVHFGEYVCGSMKKEQYTRKYQKAAIMQKFQIYD